MNGTGETLGKIDACLARLQAGDASAWDELFEHAFKRLLEQCGRIVRQQVSVPSALITENSVLAESYQRLCKAMQAENVSPTTAREFFGLTARNIRWQVQDMLRKRSEKQGDTGLFQLLTSTGPSPDESAEEGEKWELFWAAVAKLSDEDREVFDLLWVNGLSQYEAAAAIGKTRNQVDAAWRRVKVAIVKSCQGYTAFE